MLLVETTVEPSEIHGLGCFTSEFIPQGKRVWTYDRRIDLVVYESRLHAFPQAIQKHLDVYGYVVRRFFRRCIVLCGDNSRFMNHADAPNVVGNVAGRDIQAGEELTCDYTSFDLDAKKKLGGRNSNVKTDLFAPPGVLG